MSDSVRREIGIWILHLFLLFLILHLLVIFFNLYYKK